MGAIHRTNPRPRPHSHIQTHEIQIQTPTYQKTTRKQPDQNIFLKCSSNRIAREKATLESYWRKHSLSMPILIIYKYLHVQYGSTSSSLWVAGLWWLSGSHSTSPVWPRCASVPTGSWDCLKLQWLHVVPLQYIVFLSVTPLVLD